MTKGYNANKERLEEIQSFGKRAGFKCEWCEGKEGPRIWDYQPACSPNMDTLALLCERCRGLADGRKTDAKELRSIRNAVRVQGKLEIVVVALPVQLIQMLHKWLRVLGPEADGIKMLRLKAKG